MDEQPPETPDRKAAARATLNMEEAARRLTEAHKSMLEAFAHLSEDEQEECLRVHDLATRLSRKRETH